MLFINAIGKNTGQKCIDADTVFLCLCFQDRDIQVAMGNRKCFWRQKFSRQTDCTLRLIFFLILLAGIIFNIAVFFIQGRITAQFITKLLHQVIMRQPQIFINQLPQKGYPTHTVRQDMEYLQIDPFPIVSHTKQIIVVLIHRNIQAWIGIFFPHFRRRSVICFKIIPEQTSAQSDMEHVEFGKHSA